jgi:hypothetical protein
MPTAATGHHDTAGPTRPASGSVPDRLPGLHRRDRGRRDRLPGSQPPPGAAIAAGTSTPPADDRACEDWALVVSREGSAAEVVCPLCVHMTEIAARMGVARRLS